MDEKDIMIEKLRRASLIWKTYSRMAWKENMQLKVYLHKEKHRTAALLLRLEELKKETL